MDVMGIDGWARSKGSTVVLAFVMLLHSGCTKSPYANAAIAVAANVAAAAALRAATGSCYATCAYGTACDHRTGTCRPIQPEVTAEVDPCAEACEIAAEDTAAGLGPSRTLPSSCQCPPPSAPASASDPCGGMCMTDEKCVMKNGELGCE